MNSVHKDLTDRKDFIAMDTATLAKQSDFVAALNTSVAMSGKKPKQICGAINMDASQWSRCLSGDAHFPMTKYRLLANFLKCDGPLQYLMWEGDYEPMLVVRKSKVERENEALRQEVERLKHDNQVLTNAIRGHISG